MDTIAAQKWGTYYDNVCCTGGILSRRWFLLDWVGYLIMEYKGVFLKGAGWTLALAVTGTIIGCIIGFIVGIVQTIELEANCNYAKRGLVKVVKAIVRIYVEVFRGTPMIVQAMVIYYGLSIWGSSGAH